MNKFESQKSPSGADKTNLLSTAETLDLLSRLRDAVRDIVTRAEENERDFAARSAKLRTQFEQAVTNEQTRASSEITAEQAATDEKRRQIECHYTARKARIATALESASKRKLAEIDTVERQHTLDSQQGLVEADHARDAATEQNKVTRETFTARLASERTELEQLEGRARWALGGIRSLARLLAMPAPTAASFEELLAKAHENQLVEQLHDRIAKAARALTRCRALVLPVFFRLLPLWLCVLLILLVPFAFVPALRQFDFQAVPTDVWQIVGAALGSILALYFLGPWLARPSATTLATALHEARMLHDACARKAEASSVAEAERIQQTHLSTRQNWNSRWKQAQAEARSLRTEWTGRLEDQARTLNSTNEDRYQHRLANLEQSPSEGVARLAGESTARRQQIETIQSQGIAKLSAVRDATWQTLDNEWKSRVLPVYHSLQNAGEAASNAFPPWRAELWQQFNLPGQFLHAAKFADLNVDMEKLCEVALRNERLPLPATAFTLPLLLSVPRQASVLFETKQSGQEQVIGALNNLVLRLLTSAPAGRLSFTILDPVGLGQNFAGIMHLADFEARVINSRIWTQTAHIEQRLAELNEHIEKVTQMYLRNEYETLAEYNAQAGRMAEKYHFLIVADFPANFSDVAVKRLLSIAASGPRCGVHLLIHWDQRRPAPVEFVPEELQKSSLRIVPDGQGFALAAAPWVGTELQLDAPPEPDLATHLLQKIGRESVDSFRVEMPFAEVVPADDAIWSLDTTHELRVPIGRTGATKMQYLALGQGTRQHGLVAGKTGSGKSTLFHVIITNLSLWCRPEQVEFYLVDFKKGVEFKCYATNRLPHARVVAIESDREFGLSVLQRVDEELRRRGDLFRKVGAQDVAGFKRAGGNEPIPRTLLIIDEFQEFFVEDDRISQSAALLLDRIVRQGRAFGIHVLLGSQTLGGAYTLARATIGQMVVRIALQCNEADAYLIMNEDNPAPRLLSRPGEAIYNDEGGAIQGNSPFQIVWLPDQARDSWLAKVHGVAKEKHVTAEPIVFEGNAPASVRDNTVLRSLLETNAVQPVSAARIWLGAPNSIKGPTEAAFRRQSGNHLLIVGQREEAALGMLGISLVSLAAQYARAAARFFVFDCSPTDSAEAMFLERVARVIPHEIRLVRPGEVDETMAALAAEQQQRTDNPASTGPETFLFVHGMQRNKKLRFDEEMSFSMDTNAGANPGLQFNKLVCEGAGLGFHVIATCDTYNNVMRFLSRKALSEFEMRVVFQMSANDSATLIDTPQANSLGLHRAILFNGHEGWLETFRPYALPEESWIEEAGSKLRRMRA